ncbi:MAG: hypothetical protein JWO46_1970 [Nocardioidaceae bacterium]|nr:hypothetical protein [Nocardioidaceae bacterium]
MEPISALVASPGADDDSRLAHSAVGATPAAVYTALTGDSGAWLYASPQTEQLLGYTADEFVADPGLWARILHPEDRDWVLAGEAEDAHVREATRSYNEYRMIARDGRTVWVLDDATILPDAVHGSVQHGLLFDITARKVAELLVAEQARVLELVARGCALEETLRALAQAVLRVSGAGTCAVTLSGSETTFTAGAPYPFDVDEVDRLPFHDSHGVLLGELLLFGAAMVRSVQDDGAAPALGWAQRLATLAVERQHQDEAEERSYSLLEATLESTADGIVVVSVDGTVIGSNQKFQSLWRMPPAICQSDPPLRLAYVLEHVQDRAAFEARIAEVYASPLEPSHDEVLLRDGRVFQRDSQPQMLDGLPVGRVWSFRDITPTRRLEEELRRQAKTDSLTALPNRHQFLERLAELVVDRRPAGPLSAGTALLLIDMDDFKTVNDGLGHVAGDAVLVSLAGRLLGCCGPGDLAARLGGDEFALLVSCPRGTEDAERAARRVAAALDLPVVVDGRLLSIRASVGIALTDGETDATALVRNADLAMYTAKRAGGACCRTFHTDMHEQAIARLDLRADLEVALEGHGLSVAYQPLVALATGKIEGFEALARWHHPTLGEIPPTEFVQLAEETGLIGRLGAWVLERSCSDVARWRLALGEHVPTVSVNLSPLQLGEPGLAAWLGGVLRRADLPTSAVCLEITETALGQSTVDLSGALQEIRAEGIQLALDDFGTGHSSLARLGSYPFDVVKIDRSFVERLDGCGAEQAQAVVEAVLRLAEAFSLRVVAEGVETEKQREVLTRLGCERVQGFLFSAAVPAAEAAGMLAEGVTYP